MELFDQNGDAPWRNIFWIVVLAIAGVIMTICYRDAVSREKEEAKYERTTASLTNFETWVRVRKKGGREQSRQIYYKIDYKYFVAGRQFGGSADQDDFPQQFIDVYYDPRNPATHVLKRHTSDSALITLVIGGLFALVFLGVNVCLFKSKRAKLGIGRKVVGRFK